MQNKNLLNSPRLLELKNKRRKIFLNKIVIYIFLFLLIIVALIFLSRAEALNINNTDITGNQVLESAEVEQVVQTVLNDKYFWVFPKTNVLFYPKKSIEDRLSEEFKRLKDVQFSLKDRKTLEISVTERSAAYIWCGDTPPMKGEEDESKCYFLDDSGYIFDEAPYFSGDVYFKFYGPNWKEVDFEKLILFKKAFENMKLEPVAIHAETHGDVKLFLSSKNSTGVGPEIIFKIDSEFQKTMENLETALNTEPLQSNFKNKYSTLQYIDLRFGNKVYFKFR